MKFSPFPDGEAVGKRARATLPRRENPQRIALCGDLSLLRSIEKTGNALYAFRGDDQFHGLRILDASTILPIATAYAALRKDVEYFSFAFVTASNEAFILPASFSLTSSSVQ